MKKNYDFSKARKGVLHRPKESLHMPVYLDPDLEAKLAAGRNSGELSKLVNSLLRTQVKAAELIRR